MCWLCDCATKGGTVLVPLLDGRALIWIPATASFSLLNFELTCTGDDLCATDISEYDDV